jgi:hypothetical protein
MSIPNLIKIFKRHCQVTKCAQTDITGVDYVGEVSDARTHIIMCNGIIIPPYDINWPPCWNY